MQSAAAKMLCFDVYALDLRRCALMRGDRTLQLRPKAFDLLCYLAQHSGRVVPKEELIRAAWPNVLVTDDSLVQCIRDIRDALSDGAQRIIKTVPRRGYLFAADVSEKLSKEHVPVSDPSGQEITFCRTKDGVNLAVACAGRGTPLISTPTWATHLEYDWDSPTRGRLWQRLSKQFRLIRYDARGFGLSDRDIADISFETFKRDLEAVVDGLHLSRYALLAISQGTATAIAHAACYPERVSKMILHGGFALGRKKRAAAGQAEIAEAWIAIMRQGWGEENPALLRIFSSTWLPGASTEQIKWYANMLRISTSVETAIKHRSTADQIDVVDILPKVSTPTLVLHCRGDSSVPFDEGRRIAALIPNARFVSLESENHVPLPEEPAWQRFIGEIEAFLLEA